jgi:hypothetical protein
MGPGKNRVGNENPDLLVKQVDMLRNDLDRIVGELDVRRHEALDWKLQLKKHWVPLAIAAGSLLAIIGASIGLSVYVKRRRDRPMNKLKRLRRAVARAIDDPDHVAKPSPNVGLKVASAVASTAASAATGAVVKQFIHKVAPEKQLSAISHQPSARGP